MIQQYELTLPAYPRGFHLITSHVNEVLRDLPAHGLVNVFIRHTSAGLTINENAAPSVRADFESIMNKLAPEGQPYYTHNDEGPDDMPAHVKSTLTGASVTIPVTNGRLGLGTWQGIYLCEFRNKGGRRKIIITVYS